MKITLEILGYANSSLVDDRIALMQYIGRSGVLTFQKWMLIIIMSSIAARLKTQSGPSGSQSSLSSSGMFFATFALAAIKIYHCNLTYRNLPNKALCAEAGNEPLSLTDFNENNWTTEYANITVIAENLNEIG